MPALGMAQETGRLVRWLKREDEQVTKGETLMEVETDKATVEVEAPASGRLASVSASAGDDVVVGTTIATILAPGESAPDLKRGSIAAPSRSRKEASAVEEPAAHMALAARPPASPRARSLALERGVDLATLTGSGPGGAVLEEDVLKAALTAQQAAAAEPAMWRAMAENVSRSWREAPHFFVVREVDAAMLSEARSLQPGGVTYTDMLLKLVAEALRRHPRMNGMNPRVNIGLAVALPDGLIVPVIHGPDLLTVAEISEQRRAVLERARSGRLKAADLSGGTFTVSNLGMYGIDMFTAIVTQGQAGILAVGQIADRVVARLGVATVRPTLLMTLSCDHRKVDGARAAEFVQTLAEQIENPGRER